MKVSDLMTPEPQTVQPGDTVATAEEKMRTGRFRRVPVVDETGKLVGILSDGDLRQHIGYFSTTRVSAAMVENPITVAADADVETAAQLMIWHKMGGLPVVDSAGRMVGIITESDLLMALVDERNARAAREAGSAQRPS